MLSVGILIDVNIDWRYKMAGKDIKYTNRDYESILTDLKNVIKQSYPDFGNFSEHSSSQLIVELLAYLSDTHNFAIDAYYKEMFLDTAIERKNIINLGKLLGYKYKGKSRSTADLDLFINVPYITSEGIRIPDSRYFLTLEKGTIFKSNTTPTQYFELIEDIDFNNTPDDNIEISAREDNTDTDSAAVSYALKMTGKVVNGRRKTEVITVGSYVPFYKTTLTEPNILDIVSIVDGSGNVYYEVDYLAQDSVFVFTTNSATGDELTQVPYIVNLSQVSRRFIKEIDENGLTTITFGPGSESVDDNTLVPNPYQYVLSASSYAGNLIDPNNFLETSTLGISPANTTLTITYRYGGGIVSNVPAGSIINPEEIVYHWPTADNLSEKTAVYQSIASYNVEAARGGTDETSIDELRHHASGAFNAQKRAVTLQDYIALIYTMPSSLGSVYRIHASPSTGGDNSINLNILTLDTNGNLTAPYTSLTNNIKTYLQPYRMMTDTLYIQSGEIINIGIDFEIVVSNAYNKSQVLFDCIGKLKEEFHISKMDFNRPIIMSKLFDIIHNVNGVISVSYVKVNNLVGTIDGRTYSDIVWNIQNNTKNGILYSDPLHIFEIKNPNIDIRGFLI